MDIIHHNRFDILIHNISCQKIMSIVALVFLPLILVIVSNQIEA